MATPARRTRRTARTVYRGWRQRGFSEAEAGNLTAMQLHIAPSSEAPWTADGVERLLSLRCQVRKGWLTGDTPTRPPRAATNRSSSTR